MNEARQAANFLASMPIGSTTLTTKDLRALLLQTGGQLMACGYLHDIKSEALGAGVHRVTLKRRTYRDCSSNAGACVPSATKMEASMSETVDPEPDPAAAVEPCPVCGDVDPEVPCDHAQPAPAETASCTCGSGAHPRKCEVHPLGCAEHCARLTLESYLPETTDADEALRDWWKANVADTIQRTAAAEARGRDAERERVVAWLRQTAGLYRHNPGHVKTALLNRIAADIEGGKHHE